MPTCFNFVTTYSCSIECVHVLQYCQAVIMLASCSGTDLRCTCVPVFYLLFTYLNSHYTVMLTMHIRMPTAYPNYCFIFVS